MMSKTIDRTLNPDRQVFHVKQSEASSHDPRGDWVGMDGAQRWQLEKTALERLNSLDPNHWNTPELIASDQTQLTLTTRWAGWNLNECQRRGVRPQWQDLERDVQTLDRLLSSAGITLLDHDRENILWNPVTNRLVLTDFDSVVINGHPLTPRQQQMIAEITGTPAQWLLTEAQR